MTTETNITGPTPQPPREPQAKKAMARGESGSDDAIIDEIAHADIKGIKNHWDVGAKIDKMRRRGAKNPEGSVASNTRIGLRLAQDCTYVHAAFPDWPTLEPYVAMGITWTTLRVLASPLLRPDRERLLAAFRAEDMPDADVRAAAEKLRAQRAGGKMKGHGAEVDGARGQHLRRHFEGLRRQAGRVRAAVGLTGKELALVRGERGRGPNACPLPAEAGRASVAMLSMVSDVCGLLHALAADCGDAEPQIDGPARRVRDAEDDAATAGPSRATPS